MPKDPILISMAVQAVCRYYWVRAWLAYPLVGLPAVVTMWFWLKLQQAEALKSRSLWSSPPDFTKWWIGWALALIAFIPGMLASMWFRAADWVYKKSDFWGMEENNDATE